MLIFSIQVSAGSSAASVRNTTRVSDVYKRQLLGMLTEIQMLYLSMAVGQLPAFSKHKAAASFVSFILINFICQKVTSLIAKGVYDGIDYVVTPENFQHFMGVFGNMMNVSLNIGNLINLAALLLTFFATGWILKNKLNLE